MSINEVTSEIQRIAKEAIALAMQGKWQEAVQLNMAILELSSEDVDAHNRLGRALVELGRYKEAKESYRHALALSPYNSIAKKNLDRLSNLADLPVTPKSTNKVSLDVFIEEAGKAEVVNLTHVASKEVIARVGPGEGVTLHVENQKLLVKSGSDEYLGEVEPKFGLRLAKLIEGGNRYVAAISSLGDNRIKVIIREVFQHPDQIGRLSFPQKGKDNFRPYSRESMTNAREGLVRYNAEEENSAEEYDENEEDEEEGFTIADLYEVAIVDKDQNNPVMSE